MGLWLLGDGSEITSWLHSFTLRLMRMSSGGFKRADVLLRSKSKRDVMEFYTLRLEDVENAVTGILYTH